MLQADGTAWMAFFAVIMLNIALELAEEDPVYEDMASKFFEHFIAITDANQGALVSGTRIFPLGLCLFVQEYCVGF